MHVHGRAGKPKQLARYAKNPSSQESGKLKVERSCGQDRNRTFGCFPNIFLEVREVLRQDTARPKFGSVDDQTTIIGAMAMNQFRNSFAGYRQDWVLYAPVVPDRLNR